MLGMMIMPKSEITARISQKFLFIWNALYPTHTE